MLLFEIMLSMYHEIQISSMHMEFQAYMQSRKLFFTSNFEHYYCS